MILSGKKLKKAMRKDGIGAFSKKKLPSPMLNCHFDSSHGLYRDQKDKEPLLQCSIKGDFRLSILHFLAGIAVGFVTLSVFCACIKHKMKKCCKKK